jgi:hypothetical protein
LELSLDVPHVPGISESTKGSDYVMAITSMTRFKSGRAEEMVKTAKQAKIGVDL